MGRPSTQTISSQLVFDACDSPGWRFNPTRQYGMRYALCRKVKPTREAHYHWDHDQTIGNAILLSSLIRPTTIGTSLAARLYFIDGELQTIVAGRTQSNCSHARVVADDNYRDWLSVSELEQLRDLLPRYNRNAPERVRLAREHIDLAFYAYFLDERLVSLVTSFESLLKTSRRDLTGQFKARASCLAALLGMELSREDLHTTYEHRSDFVHGSPPNCNELSTELLQRYNKCERVLRFTLLRASTETDFADYFSSSGAIEKAFGSPEKPTPDQKLLALLSSLSDEEVQAEYARRYGRAGPEVSPQGLQHILALVCAVPPMRQVTGKELGEVCYPMLGQ